MLKTTMTIPQYQKHTGRLARSTRSRGTQDDRCRSIQSPGRCHWCPTSHSSSCSPSLSPSPYWSNRSPRGSTKQCTPFQYNQDSIEVIPSFPANSIKTSAHPKEGSLFMEWASDSWVSFYTCRMLPTKNGTKSMMVKINLVFRWTQYYWAGIGSSSSIKSASPGTPNWHPYPHFWISHYGKPKPFLGYFIANVNHVTEPRSYATCFYVFEDATSPQFLLSYAMSACLGILEFMVLILVAQVHIDALTVPTFSNLGGLRKIAKCITFWNPLIDLDQPHCTSTPCGSSSGLRKTAKMKIVQFKDPIDSVTINGTFHKGPSSSSIKLPLPASKVNKPSPPTTKPKSALKTIKPQVTFNTFFHCCGPGHCHLEVSISWLLWYHRQHV